MIEKGNIMELFNLNTDGYNKSDDLLETSQDAGCWGCLVCASCAACIACLLCASCGICAIPILGQALFAAAASSVAGSVTVSVAGASTTASTGISVNG